MKPIKIVYSWIGPKGPIWNTEIPNVLSFANVAHGSKTDTHRYWADDVWDRLFNLRRPECELHPATVIEDQDVFIYPYSLAWRVPFENYFLNDAGIIEFSQCPNHIVHQVRRNSGYFLIDLSVEAFVQPHHLSLLTSYFKHLSIPLYKVIYLTGCMNAKSLYEKWCNENSIPNDEYNRMNIITYPVGKQRFANQLKYAPVPEYNETVVPEKLFLMWNRRYRSHRIALTLALDRAGLLDRSYISMGLTDPEIPTQHFTHVANIYLSEILGLNGDDINKLVSKLPLVLDGETDVNVMCEDPAYATRKYYQNSLVSIITETNYELSELTLTEKTFKATKEKHPFIIVGVPGALKAMRELGYKTFSEFWDESYDEIEDQGQRMLAIEAVCKYIGSWSTEQILQFKRNVKSILEHNFNVAKGKPSDYVSDRIFEIIRSHEGAKLNAA